MTGMAIVAHATNTPTLAKEARVGHPAHDSRHTTHDCRDIAAYRGRTTALLRRYFRLSLDLGRVPSVLGREFFRARVTSYRVQSFEDVVIFVHDVEQCLNRLDEFSRALVGRIVLQEYTWEEAAALLRCGRRTVARRFPQALDRLSEIFLGVGLLRPFPAECSSCCQEPEQRGNAACVCALGK